MFLAILHSVHFYLNSLFYYCLLKYYQKSIFTAGAGPLLIIRLSNCLQGSDSYHMQPVFFSYFCYILFLTLVSPEWLPSSRMDLLLLLLWSLPVHHNPPKFFTSEYLPAFHFLSRNELCSFLNERVYSKWQQVWESSDTGFTTRYFFPHIKDRTSLPLDLNLFFKQALTAHNCLCYHFFQFKLFSSPACPYSKKYRSLSMYYLIVLASTPSEICLK